MLEPRFGPILQCDYLLEFIVSEFVEENQIHLRNDLFALMHDIWVWTK